MADSVNQYLRHCRLIVFQNGQDQGLDLSNLRIKFSVKKSDVQTPNVADIRVYNLSQEAALNIFQNLSPNFNSETNPLRGRVLLEAGYDSNYGVIFLGNIKQVILGRESATDDFVELVCGDGERAYNFSIVNTTLKKGSTQQDQVNAATASMASKGVTPGSLGDFSSAQLPRGKVMFGNARNYLNSIAKNSDKTWSIQDEKITMIPVKSFLPGVAVRLTSKTGLIGTPQQTNNGVNVKCLLNPTIQVGGRIDINDAIIAELQINNTQLTSNVNLPPQVTTDGLYYAMVVQHTGDTRGTEWYTDVVGIIMDPSTGSLNQVQTGFGP